MDISELTYAVKHDERVVRIDFGSNISSIEAEPRLAIAFANSILLHARGIPNNRLTGDSDGT